MVIYAAYTDIYQPNPASIDANFKLIRPTVGSNFEGGIKWESVDQKLNVTLSGYYIRKHGFADYVGCTLTDQSRCSPNTSAVTPGSLVDTAYCCYVYNDRARERSFGADVEVTGEIARGWQISVSYDYNKNFPRDPATYAGLRQPLQSYMPNHLYKIWTTYEFSNGSALRGLTIGFGINGQSKTFVADQYCPEVQPVVPYGCKVDTLPINFSDTGHIIFGASLGYKVSEQLRVDVQAENLLDKSYLETVGYIYGGNFYGAPRNVKVSLRGKF